MSSLFLFYSRDQRGCVPAKIMLQNAKHLGTKNELDCSLEYRSTQLKTQ